MQSSLHSIAPYVGKVPPNVAQAMVIGVEAGSRVIDPFCGSGGLLLEAQRSGAIVEGYDINRYAVVLTRAKLNPPKTIEEANERVERLNAALTVNFVEESEHPDWVRRFFHPRTLNELSFSCEFLRNERDWFTLACLLGILHHQRPGFLSYPSSNFVPYLRDKKFPREEYPELYEYRAVIPRLRAKVERVMDNVRPIISESEPLINERSFFKQNFGKRKFDLILTSPPYMGTLTYGRDNRLRLYFLGVSNGANLDQHLPTTSADFFSFLKTSFGKFEDILSSDGTVTMILGSASRKYSSKNLARTAIKACEESRTSLKVVSLTRKSWTPRGNDRGELRPRVRWNIRFRKM